MSYKLRIRQNFNHKKAFTLMEMLIVIFIIVILAAVAIANFGVARQKAKIDLVADTIISVFKQQQNLSINQNKCFGVELSTIPPYVNLAQTDYSAINNELKRADFCDLSNKSVKKLSEIEDFIIKDLKENESGVESVNLFFKPPFGITSNEISDVPGSGKIIQFTITNNSKSESRSIEFDSATGLVKRI